MQRRNYAGLFAALVIGFAAIDAQAAEVRSVTITAPDSGATLGIGGEFTVQVVVEGLHAGLRQRRRDHRLGEG